MNQTEAAHIVNLITATWPTGPKGYIWTDALAELQHDHALNAYRQLRDELDRPPTIHQFKITYRAQIPSSSNSPPRRCELCDGTGWTQAPDFQAHGHTYTAVEPCRCRR